MANKPKGAKETFDREDVKVSASTENDTVAPKVDVPETVSDATVVSFETGDQARNHRVNYMKGIARDMSIGIVKAEDRSEEAANNVVVADADCKKSGLKSTVKKGLAAVGNRFIELALKS